MVSVKRRWTFTDNIDPLRRGISFLTTHLEAQKDRTRSNEDTHFSRNSANNERRLSNEDTHFSGNSAGGPSTPGA